MLEQETASIIKYLLDKAGNPYPYYYKVPQSFLVPAMYFPPPKIDTCGDTLNTYTVEYSWIIKFFHKNTQEAYQLAFMVLTAIKGNRNYIPLINTTGEETGKIIRIKDTSVSEVDDGAVQLVIKWDSQRLYDTSESSKVKTYHLEHFLKSDTYKEKFITAKSEKELEKLIKDLNNMEVKDG